MTTSTIESAIANLCDDLRYLAQRPDSNILALDAFMREQLDCIMKNFRCGDAALEGTESVTPWPFPQS